MIRHARLRSTPAVFPLAVAMIEPAFQTLLVAAVGASALTNPRLAPACQTAIALSAITARTEKEGCTAIAGQANPKSQNLFATTRHASPQAGLDKDDGFVPPWNQLGCGGLTKVAIPEPRRFQRRGSSCYPPSTPKYTFSRLR